MQTGTASSYKGSTPVNRPLGISLKGPENSRGAVRGSLPESWVDQQAALESWVSWLSTHLP